MVSTNKRIWETIIAMFLLGLLAYLLYWRYQISATRFFDIDELAYLHWTAQVARGERMYVDFFSYFTPGFMWAFAPIFWIYGVSTQVFTAARMVSFVIFLGIVEMVGLLFGATRSWKWALLPMILLAFLPLPYEKFLEIRPDNLATFLAFGGLLTEMRALRRDKKALLWWFISGLLYSASLFVLAKTIPFVLVGAGVAAIAIWPKKEWQKFRLFLLGLGGPWVLFFSALWVQGQAAVAWDALVHLPFIVYGSFKNYYMVANLFFWPNWWLYGGDGNRVTMGMIVNHSVWILAIFMGTYRLVTAFGRDREEGLRELLMAGTFFVSILAYVKFFPFKHGQYLIPIAVFVAYFAADGLSIFFNWIAKVGSYVSLLIVLLGFGYVLFAVNKDINTFKLLLTTEKQMKEMSELINVVPISARVVDLEGRMLFWPAGYPICCLPFDTFLPNVVGGPPPLSQYLSSHPAEYIYGGETDRFNTLSPENISYIRTHYTPVPGFDERLRKRK